MFLFFFGEIEVYIVFKINYGNESIKLRDVSVVMERGLNWDWEKVGFIIYIVINVSYGFSWEI